MNRTLNEYFAASWKFFVTIFIIMVIIVLLRLISDFPASIQSFLSVGGVVFIGLAGFTVVRNHGFNLKQAGFVGLLLSFSTHWSTLIFHKAGEMLYIILINSIIFFIVAVFGGWLAKKPKMSRN